MDRVLVTPHGISVLVAEGDAQTQVEYLEFQVVGKQEILKWPLTSARPGRMWASKPGSVRFGAWSSSSQHPTEM